MFAEPITDFFDAAAGFALAATLNGSAVSVIVDDQALEQFDGGIVLNMPSVLLTAAQAASAAAGQTLLVGAATYTVRSVNDEPPDGALVRLMLAKA